ncbi:MAG: hypothetical protein QNJ16_03575 [Rhodobacter sp.]|nr:hypothetical protein [Rhodobacter sp.]
MTPAALHDHPALTPEEIDRRIAFHDDIEVMEVDFSGLHLLDSADVNAVYDRLEERIAETGEDLWFFMVNYSDSRIDPDAWFAFSRRGKTLNMAHSMGSVRFDASEATRRQIERDAKTEAFDPNLFADRDSALKRLAELPSRRLKKIVHTPTYTRADFEPRVTFDAATKIMNIDLSGLKLHHSRDVDDLIDYLQELIEASGRKWYFLINYNNCHIDPGAWVEWAKRGKELNLGGSLGTVRYEAGSETEADIRLRAETQGFRPNIRNTREEALERIAEMKAEAGP